MVVVIATVGQSGSGKTTTLEFLISALTKEGYIVGAIKHIHRKGFTIDKEGSNTWRFSNAGSRITVAMSPQEIAIIKKTSNPLGELDNVIETLMEEHLDVIFIEGFHSFIEKTGIIKIVTAKNEEDLDNTLKKTSPPILAIAGLVAKTKHEKSEIPFTNLPEDCERLLRLVKEQIPTKPKRVSLGED